MLPLNRVRFTPRRAQAPFLSAHACSSNKQARLCTVVRAGASVEAATALRELKQLIQPTQCGLSTTTQQQHQILSTVAQIRAASGSSSTTDSSSLSATWRLLWTTEKETLFIMQNAGWFGTKAGAVYQVIDVDAKRLQNVITFPPSGAFIVDSSIAVEGPQRVSFRFNAAKLKTAGRDFGVPPFGQGWFDTIYCDEDLRIAQDIRGDTLIVARDGPPRIFS